MPRVAVSAAARLLPAGWATTERLNCTLHKITIIISNYFLLAALPSMSTRKPGFFQHYEELVGTWTRRLRNRQRAEDLAHDAFVRVLEGEQQQGQQEVQQPRAYLHQITRNIAVDQFRRDERRALVEQGASGMDEAGGGDPESLMHALQLAESIEQALVELPLKCRQVFIWQKLDGLSQAEIAERLGLSRNMVERYMIRTLRHLRDRLDLSPP